jgi:hypothetical protein
MSVARLSSWRVAGELAGASCLGPVRIVLGRRDRALKQTGARLKRCRLDAIVSTTSRSPGRWLQVRAGSVVSRRVPVR